MISITKVIQIHIQIPADSFVSDTNGFNNSWFRSMATRGERQFLKVYANHTMLTPPQRAAHLVTFKISIHLCRSRSEKLNCCLGMTSSTLQSHFLSGVWFLCLMAYNLRGLFNAKPTLPPPEEH